MTSFDESIETMTEAFQAIDDLLLAINSDDIFSNLEEARNNLERILTRMGHPPCIAKGVRTVVTEAQMQNFLESVRSAIATPEIVIAPPPLIKR